MEVWFVVILCILVPGYYGYLARSGTTTSDMVWATTVSVLLCLGILFVLNPQQMGPVIGGGFIGVALAVLSVFMSPKGSDSENSKTTKQNIKNFIHIFGSAMVLIIAFANKYYL
ncbi:hypothetical protein [Pseudomonas synxantha]|uniref:hypothetical protein n=1 Tax=Pseudomonas synxantha TaxID=47883 RepID=UPI0006146F8F|nr:hypothetical protein [Pseudomonas synxantha]